MKNLTSLIANIAFLVVHGDITAYDTYTSGLEIKTLTDNFLLIDMIIKNLSDGKIKSATELPIDKPVTFEFSDDLTVIFTRKF